MSTLTKIIHTKLISPLVMYSFSAIYTGKLDDGSVIDRKGSVEEPHVFVSLGGTCHVIHVSINPC